MFDISTTLSVHKHKLLCALLAILGVTWRLSTKSNRRTPQRSYSYYKKILKQCSLPLAFIDLDLMDENIKKISKVAEKTNKTIRIASKSIRSVDVLQYILKTNPVFKGIMCYSVKEALFLSNRGLDDLLVAYPCMQDQDIVAVCNVIQKKKIILMVDCVEHVMKINKIAKGKNVVIPICIDIDLSLCLPFLHFGVYRSSLFEVKDVISLYKIIQQCKHVKLVGLMGYDSQLAGIADHSPVRGWLMNKVLALLKILSKGVHKKLQQVATKLREMGAKLEFINSGGTGSLLKTSQIPCVTEITVGSGFYSPGLFDYYKDFLYFPAAAYAIEITRNPKPGIYTCHGGGYIASGSIGIDKEPVPYLPSGARLRPGL